MRSRSASRRAILFEQACDERWWKEYAEELEKLGHKVDRKIIVVKDAVKEVGSYKAIVKLHKEVSVEIPFEVVAE